MSTTTSSTTPHTHDDDDDNHPVIEEDDVDENKDTSTNINSDTSYRSSNNSTLRFRSNVANNNTNNNTNTNNTNNLTNNNTTTSTSTNTNTTSTTTSTSTTSPSLKEESSSTTNSNSNNGSGDMFECNICFDTVNEPVVTQCGHLFCWSCIFQWLQHNSSQQCPVCKAPVSEEKLIPIYGRGNSSDPRKKRPSSIPSRPPGRPETERTFRGNNFNYDFFNGGNQWNGGGISFSAGFGLFPGLFGLHFYQTNNNNNNQQQQQTNNGNNPGGSGGPTEFESIFLSRMFFAIGLIILFFVLFG